MRSFCPPIAGVLLDVIVGGQALLQEGQMLMLKNNVAIGIRFAELSEISCDELALGLPTSYAAKVGWISALLQIK